MSDMAEKNQTRFSSLPLFPNSTQFSKRPHNSEFAPLASYEEKDIVYKRRIRILRVVSRLGSFILSAYMMGSEGYALAKYFLTKNHIIAGNAHPWATPTTLWPTLMLLGISTITFAMNLITLCTYLCGVGAANKTSSFFSVISYVTLAAHVVVWAVAMGLFKMANTGSDLWGFSCGSESDVIQEQVHSFLDFGKLCTLQTGSWYSSILETINYLITFIVTLLVVRRASHKKKIAEIRESMSMEAGYTRNTQEIEMGTSYRPGVGRTYIPVSEESLHP